MFIKLILLMFLFFSSYCIAQDTSETYHNPVDGKNYVAPEGWNTYKPDQGALSPENKKVRRGVVRLLNTQKDFEERTSAIALATYLREVEKIAVSVFSSSTKKAVVLVQFKSMPNRTELKIAYEGKLAEDLLQEFYNQANAVKPIKISHGELSYQVEYQVSP